MTTITFDATAFRAQTPQFANETTYPTAVLQARFDLATGFVSPEVYGDMTQTVRTQALYLATAHLMALGLTMAQGGYTGQPGIVTASSVGDVSVTLAVPPYGTSAWKYWLNLTPYGAQLLALLDVQSVGGFFAGGRPERAAFRKVGGVF